MRRAPDCGSAPRARACAPVSVRSVRARVRLRRARTADLAALLALERRAFRGDRLSARQFRHHLRNPSAWFAVAEIEGQLGGNALLFFRRGSRVARLYSIVVAASARGRGVGARLLAAAEAAARQRGCGELRLEVRRDNAAAIRLYEGAGYRRVAELPHYYADGAAGWRYARPIASRTIRRRP